MKREITFTATIDIPDATIDAPTCWDMHAAAEREMAAALARAWGRAPEDVSDTNLEM